jgi:Prophage CP4-57 regulatory protein (AlpA).
MSTFSEKKLLSMSEVLQILPISRSLLYKLVKNENIKKVSLGRRIFITTAEIERLLGPGAGDSFR